MEELWSLKENWKIDGSIIDVDQLSKIKFKKDKFITTLNTEG